jgi:hypothetical protein
MWKDKIMTMLEAVIQQIGDDLLSGETEALELLLSNLTEDQLVAYLSEARDYDF